MFELKKKYKYNKLENNASAAYKPSLIRYSILKRDTPPPPIPCVYSVKKCLLL